MKQSVTLKQGIYSGHTDSNGIVSVKAIPYAAPPIGELRFQAPQPLPGGNDSFSGENFGPSCPQATDSPKHGKGRFGSNHDEDCLYLNVYTPALDGKRRPVMFWIHGGAFILGNADAYRGGHLAEQGDIVVVTINYRLGALGFVDMGAVTGEALPSNNGIRDIIAALQWVKDNIEAFGGDPEQVTISGESAGSMAVSLLLLADSARGLFHQAIMQSGSINLIQDRASAKATSDAYRDILGNPTRTELQAMPVRELLEAQIGAGKLLGGAIPAAPFWDGDILPASLEIALKKPPAPVPLIAGFTREETALFEKIPILKGMRLDRPFLEQQINRDLDEQSAEKLLKLYPDTKKGSRALATDMYFAASTRHTAERQAELAKCWFYRFDYEHIWLGAAHGLELLFLWDMKGLIPALIRGGPLTGKRLALAQFIRESWINFIRDGDPGANWTAFEKQGQDIMLLGMTREMAADPCHETRAAWDNLEIAPRNIS